MSNQINETLPLPEGQEENGRDTADYLSFRPGQRLRKARELRGMSIEQVGRELALTPRYVEAMESDAYKSLPEPAFVRGYMRRYAQLVKLSPDDIAAKFDQCYAEDKETPALEVRPRNPIQILGEIARQPRLKPRRLLSWAAFAFVLVLLAGIFWNGLVTRSPFPAAEDPLLAPPPATTAPVPPAVPEAGVPVVPAPAPAVPGLAPAVPAPAPAMPAPGVAPSPAPSPAPGMNLLPAPASPPILPTPGAAAPATPPAPVRR